MVLSYWKHELPFKHPFEISGGRIKSVQRTLIVALGLGNHIGFGEAPEIAYYGTDIDTMATVLDKYRSMIEKFALTDPARYWHYLHHLLPNDHFLVAALDMACWDLFAKMRGKKIFEMWAWSWGEVPPTCFTIGIGSVEAMRQKMQEHPWPIYKIKLGMTDPVGTVSALRETTDAAFFVDVNGGWDLDTALNVLPRLKELGVTLVEQPLPAADRQGQQVLFERSPLPLFADESCVVEKDVESCKGGFHGINIKLSKCSGITPALRMIETAKSLGMSVMIGCMNESSIGCAAIAQFLPRLDHVDMDGPLLHTVDLAQGLVFDETGRASLKGKTGLGIVPAF